MSGVTSIRRCAAAIAAASGGDFRREVSGGLQSGFDGGYLEQTGEARARLFHEDRETLRVDLAHAAQVNLEVTFANEFAESPRNLNTAQWNPGEHDRFQIGVLLNDFMRDPPQRAPDCFGVHYRDGASRTGSIFVVVFHLHPLRPRGIALKAYKI